MQFQFASREWCCAIAWRNSCAQVSNMQVYLNRGVQAGLPSSCKYFCRLVASLHCQGLVVALALWCTYCTVAGEIQAAPADGVLSIDYMSQGSNPAKRTSCVLYRVSTKGLASSMRGVSTEAHVTVCVDVRSRRHHVARESLTNTGCCASSSTGQPCTDVCSSSCCVRKP